MVAPGSFTVCLNQEVRWRPTFQNIAFSIVSLTCKLSGHMFLQ